MTKQTAKPQEQDLADNGQCGFKMKRNRNRKTLSTSHLQNKCWIWLCFRGKNKHIRGLWTNNQHNNAGAQKHCILLERSECAQTEGQTTRTKGDDQIALGTKCQALSQFAQENKAHNDYGQTGQKHKRSLETFTRHALQNKLRQKPDAYLVSNKYEESGVVFEENAMQTQTKRLISLFTRKH